MPNAIEVVLDPFFEGYDKLVADRHPNSASRWPCTKRRVKLIGWTTAGLQGRVFIGGWVILVAVDDPTAKPLKYSWNLSETREDGVDTELAQQGILLSEECIEQARLQLGRLFGTGSRDSIILLRVEPDKANYGGFRPLNLESELAKQLKRHEIAMGIAKQRIFLSHKHADKAMVRDMYETLKHLGFQPWLDDDDMAAGANLNRSLLQGMKDSCAAVFFVTKEFQDKGFVGDEVDYAKNRAREQEDSFRIITLVYDDADANVPSLFRESYVYKKVHSSLDALRRIIDALPIVVGPVQPRV